jgi:hypothetical protein
MSSTASDERHRRTRLSVTTMGRLIRIGRHHGIQPLVIRHVFTIKAQVQIGRALLTQQFMRRDAHTFDQRDQQVAIRRGQQVGDHMRQDARFADQSQRVARGTTGGVMIDDDVMLGAVVMARM